MLLELHLQGADFSHIHVWFVVNREAYGEGLRLLMFNKYMSYYEESNLSNAVDTYGLCYGKRKEETQASIQV